MYMTKDKLQKLVEEFDYLPTADSALCFAAVVLRTEADALKRWNPYSHKIVSMTRAAAECERFAKDIEKEKFG